MAVDIPITAEYANILDCLGEGPIGGVIGGLAGVYLDDIPVVRADGTTNIKDVEAYFRIGEEFQSYISGTKSASSVISVNSGTIVHGGWEGSIEYSPEVSLNTEMDAIVVSIYFPQGLSGIKISDGEERGYWASWDVKYRSAGMADWSFFPGSNYSSVWTDIAWNCQNQTGISIGQTANMVYCGLDRDNTYGCVFHVHWWRPGSAGNYTGNTVTMTLEYKKYGTTTWKTLFSNRRLDYTTAIGNPYPTPANHSYNSFMNWELCAYIPEEYTSYDYRLTYNSGDGGRIVGSSPKMIIKEDYSGREEVNGQNNSDFKIYRYYKIPEDAQNDLPVTIKVRRTSLDDDEYMEYNDNRYYVGPFNLSTIETVLEEKLSYPFSALVALKFDASSYSTLPKRSYDTKLLIIKVPDNYDPISRVYTGLWTGGFKEEWSDNPAWAFYDLVTKERYGMGEYIKEHNINKWTLYEIAKFCDELVDNGYGGQEPRYTVNTYIQRQEEALTLVKNLASIFRGIVYWLNDKITCAYDHPSDPIAEFSNANVVDGSFTYSGSAKNTRYNTVNVAWNDPLHEYKIAIEVVEDDRVVINEVKKKDLTALGCTSRSQARRQGKAFLATERETVTFACSLDSVSMRPGDLINIYDRYRANIKYSGRKIKLDNTFATGKIYLDAPIDNISSGITYTLKIMTSDTQTETLPDGTIQDRLLPKYLSFTFIDTDYNSTEVSISVNTTFEGSDLWTYYTSKIIPPNSLWTISETNIPPQLFRVVSISEREPNIFEVDSLEFNQTKQAWIDENVNMTAPPDPISGGSLYAIDSVIVSESLKSYGNSIANIISIGWGREATLGIKHFEVWYKYDANVQDGGNWIYYSKVTDSSYTDLPPNTEAGWYAARVSVVLDSGLALEYVESTSVYMSGVDAPPADITNFTYTILDSGTLRLTWAESSDFNFSHYEVQNHTTDFNWNDLGIVKYTNLTNNTLDISNSFESDFLVKAINTEIIESENATRLVIGVTNPSINSISGIFTTSGYRITWNTVQETFPIDYIKVESNSNNTGGKVIVGVPTSNLYETVDLTYWSDIISPTIHTYYLTPYDTQGNFGSTISYQTNLPDTQIQSLTVTAPFNDAFVNINCVWQSTAFPVKCMEYYLDDEYIREVNTQAFSDTMLNSGTYKFGFIPIDIANRKGILAEQTIIITSNISRILDTNIRMDETLPDYMLLSNNTLMAPVGVSETWAEHFSLRGYATIQDQIDAGYIYYLISNPETWEDHFIDRGYTTIQDQIDDGYLYYTTPVIYSEIYTLPGGDWTGTSSEFCVYPTGTGGDLDLDIYTRIDLGTWVQATFEDETPERTKFSVAIPLDEIRVDYIFSEISGIPHTLSAAQIIGDGQT